MATIDIAPDLPLAASSGRESAFHRLLAKLPAGAYICDLSGLITYFNAQAAELWGRAPKLNDPEDRYCGSLRLRDVDGSPIAKEECCVALALRNNQEYSGRELVIERPDGRRVNALAHVIPMHDEHGQVCGAVNVLFDVSERRAAEQVLRDTNRYKDEFLATLSHELRNPLAPLRNALQILNLQMAQSPDTHFALSVIDRQMKQMTRVIEDLMDLSRITRNKLKLQRQQARLADIVHAAMETSQPLIEAGGHSFTLQMPGEALTLEADSVRLSQVISNLLNNAAKFTPCGGHITLRVEYEGNEAVLRVRDTGIGIAAESLPMIFEMFAQADRSLERSHAGLGVGLTLVRHLVELHGGKVEATSGGRNLGAEFVIRLPATGDSRDRPQSVVKSEGDEVTVSLRILVVDDNVDAAMTTAALLGMLGHEVRTAHDGVEALEEVNRFKPDVAILDIGMPKMNGYTTAKHIRERMSEAQPLLIALTGWGQEEDRRRSQAAGFDHHLVKPVDPAALTALIRTRPGSRILH